MGPKSEALLRTLGPDDLSKTGLPFSMTAEIDVGLARVRAARMSYVGGPGYEDGGADRSMPDALRCAHGQGRRVRLKDAGYYTIDALRVEAGRRAWGAELSPDETPYEAGLNYAVNFEKPAAFIGRDALLAQLEAGVRKRLVMFAFDDPAAFPWGRRAHSDGRAQRRRADLRRIQPQVRRAIGMGYARSLPEGPTLTDEAILAARYRDRHRGDLFAVTPHMQLR
jgi:4-methylaminobutanoate oxidase (formaldehyde-forming)